jgi:hypothetical protein
MTTGLLDLVASLMSWALVLAPYPTVRGFVAAGTTGNVSVIPFLCAHLNACGWLSYG